MEFKIERDLLASLLAKVYPIIPGKSTMPSLSNALLEAREGKLCVTGTDLESSVTAMESIELSEDGDIALNGKNLYNIVRELPSTTLNFKVANLIATIKYKNGSFTMGGIPKEDYPKLPVTGNDSRQVNIPFDTLQRAVDKTIFAAALGDSNALLSGGLLDLRQDEFRLVTTDGHRLALFKTQSSGGKIAQLLVPSRIWKEVINFSSGIDIIFEEKLVGFHSPGMRVMTRLMEGEFPPYESVIPKDNDKLLKVSRGELIEALRRVIVFAPEISKVVKLNLTHESIRLESASEDGEANEVVACKYTGPELEAGYNGNYLLSMLIKIESDEVEILLKDPLSAVLITPSEKRENEEITYLLMPVRLE